LAPKANDARSRRARQSSRSDSAADATRGDYITTAVHIPQTTHDLLRRVAFNRALEGGGRASVSALIVEIVESQRKKLELEAKSA
jgi:hypothetical protein